MGNKLSVVELDECPVRHQPEVTGLIMVDRVDRIVWQAVGGRVGGELSVLKASQSFLGCCPEYAGSIPRECPDSGTLQPTCHRIRSADAILEAHELAGFGPEPQDSAAVFDERRDPVTLQSWCVGRVEDRETNAVEAREAAKRGKPQISIARLHDGGDGVLREAVFGGPDRFQIWIINRGCTLRLSRHTRTAQQEGQDR